MISGPLGLKLIKGFHDEALRGEWQGYRSSRLGEQYRVIYRVISGRSLFQVVHITPHDYRKNGTKPFIRRESASTCPWGSRFASFESYRGTARIRWPA